MKKVLRSFAVGLLVGGLVGLWSGMNIGKGQPLLSNPFSDVRLGQQAGRTADAVHGQAARVSAQVGEAVQSTSEQVADAAERAIR